MTTDTCEIPLSRGYVALVDAVDYDDLMQFSWHVNLANGGPYARRAISRAGGRKGATELMHRRLIPGASRVDHINHDGLDNRRSNLRAATHAENLRNRAGVAAKNTSGFRGVSWHKGHRDWHAHVKLEGRQRSLGCFATAEDAARAFDAAAIEDYGEFVGYLNFSEEASTP